MSLLSVRRRPSLTMLLSVGLLVVLAVLTASPLGWSRTGPKTGGPASPPPDQPRFSGQFVPLDNSRWADLSSASHLPSTPPAHTPVPGSGGDGAFLLAAPAGVYLSGLCVLGCSGQGVVFGDLTSTGTLRARNPLNYPYSAWETLPATGFYLYGGSGGGGAGGDGQILVDKPRTAKLPPADSPPTRSADQTDDRLEKEAIRRWQVEHGTSAGEAKGDIHNKCEGKRGRESLQIGKDTRPLSPPTARRTAAKR